MAPCHHPVVGEMPIHKSPHQLSIIVQRLWTEPEQQIQLGRLHFTNISPGKEERRDQVTEEGVGVCQEITSQRSDNAVANDLRSQCCSAVFRQREMRRLFVDIIPSDCVYGPYNNAAG